MKGLREKTKQAVFSDVLEMKESHSKVSNILYQNLKIQDYLKSSKFSIDKKQLFFENKND